MTTTLLPVQLVVEGEPFDRAAVVHTLRHLAMRAGWQFVRDSAHWLVYAVDASGGRRAGTRLGPQAVVVLSGPEVADHLRRARRPVPVATGADGRLRPFPQRLPSPRPGWIDADVIAGAHTCMNLWYERRTQPAVADGWITWEQDWMARAGLADPLPLADQWLDMIHDAALQMGWPAIKPQRQSTIVLTHDVDYLPGPRDRGLPRLARAVYRQLALRRRPADALRLLSAYLGRAAGSLAPYLELPRIVAAEQQRGARSSFQFVVAHAHPADPQYAAQLPSPVVSSGKAGGDGLANVLSRVPPGWEVCLHGSYGAARSPGKLAAERVRLETLIGRGVQGFRQHYLNFEPAGLFREVAAAQLRYDMSVGYNDRSGPRAGTYFAFRPYDMEARQEYTFWEIPFVLMDTTLATTYRLGPHDALAHARRVLQPAISAGGCAAIIWHQEQCGGLLDPGYERVYFDLLDGLAAAGVRLTSGGALLPELDAAWAATVAAGGAAGAGS